MVSSNSIIIITTVVSAIVIVATIFSVLVVRRKSRIKLKLKQHVEKTQDKNKLYPVIYDANELINYLKLMAEPNKNQKQPNFELTSSLSYKILQDTSDVFIYIHVCMIGSWKNILTDLLTKCQENHLLQNCKKCNIVAVGDPSRLEHLDKILKSYQNCELRHHSTKVKLYERTTLGIMWDDATKSTNNFKMLYLHYKGVTRNRYSEIECVRDWVNFMCNFTITNHILALTTLGTFDACGVNFSYHPKPHFSGNFWWTNSFYLRKLSRSIGRAYLDPEMWICSDNEAIVISMAQSDTDHYKQRYKPDNYKHKPIVLQSNKATMSLPKLIHTALPYIINR